MGRPRWSTLWGRATFRSGRLVAKDSDSYQYLAESIRKHPDQDTLKEMMEDAGFCEVEYHNMTGGIVALHRGVKA